MVVTGLEDRQELILAGHPTHAFIILRDGGDRGLCLWAVQEGRWPKQKPTAKDVIAESKGDATGYVFWRLKSLKQKS